MAAAYVQYWQVGVNGGTTCTVTVSGATANNLLVAIVTVNVGADSFTTPSGWALIGFTDSDSGATDFGSAVYWRIASGTSADDFTPVWTDSGYAACVVAEYSGLGSSSPLEDWGENVTYIATNTTALNTGSATPITADGMAVAFHGISRADQWNAGSSYNNGYTLARRYSAHYTGGYSIVGHKAYSTTAAQDTTNSTIDTGDVGYGLIAVFKEPGGGGGSATVSGNLQAQSASVSANVTGYAVVSVSGDLQSQSASVSATINATAPAATVSGNLIAQSASIDASVRGYAVVSVSGDLTSQSASITANVNAESPGAPVSVSGDLQAQSAIVNATINATTQAVTVSGDLVAQSASIDATVQVPGTTSVSGDLHAQSATIAASVKAYSIVSVSGELTAQNATINASIVIGTIVRGSIVGEVESYPAIGGYVVAYTTINGDIVVGPDGIT